MMVSHGDYIIHVLSSNDIRNINVYTTWYVLMKQVQTYSDLRGPYSNHTYLWCDVIVEITDNRYSLLPWRRAALDWTDIIHLSIRLKAPSQNLLSTKLQYNITAPTDVVLCLTITRHWLCSYCIHKYVYPYDKLHVQKTLNLLVLSTRKRFKDLNIRDEITIIILANVSGFVFITQSYDQRE